MNLKEGAGKLKSDVPALAMALKDAGTPTATKTLAGITVAYALSPIDLIPSGGVLRCLSRKAASSRKYMATTMELCTQQIYARMGVLDILCAIRAARPHIVLLFKTQERGCNAGKRHASSHFGEASNTSPER